MTEKSKQGLMKKKSATGQKRQSVKRNPQFLPNFLGTWS